MKHDHEAEPGEIAPAFRDLGNQVGFADARHGKRPQGGQRERGGERLARHARLGAAQCPQAERAEQQSGERVEKTADLESAIDRALAANASGKTALLDVFVTP